MPYNLRLAERVRRALVGRGEVVEKRMVGGGLSFIVEGRMFCGVAGESLMVRVGAEERAAALAEPHARPMVLGGKQLVGFVLVSPDAIKTSRALTSWLNRSVASGSGIADKRFAELVDGMSGRGGVALIAGKRGFGQGTLQVKGRIFAMVTHGAIVLKLPTDRVASLIASGEGSVFGAGRDRAMKEWVTLSPATRRWRKLATEARDFVALD